VNVGQTFTAFGWGNDAGGDGFPRNFLGSSDTRPPVIVMWLIVWLLSAPCSVLHDQKCAPTRAGAISPAFFHYETQSCEPAELVSASCAALFHKAGVLSIIHELIVPWFLFRARAALTGRVYHPGFKSR